MSIGTRTTCFPQKGPRTRSQTIASEEVVPSEVRGDYETVIRIAGATCRVVEEKAEEASQLVAPTGWLEDNSEDDPDDEHDDDISR